MLKVLEMLNKLETAGQRVVVPEIFLMTELSKADAFLLLIHCSQDLYDAQPGIFLVLESHHRILQDLEASAGQLGHHLLLHHRRVKQRVERKLEEIVEDGHRLQPLGVPVPSEVVISSLFTSLLLST